MRGLLVLALLVLAVPLSGCVSGPAATLGVIELFADRTLPEGDPAPVPVQSCEELLGILNGRMLQEADTRIEQQGIVYHEYVLFHGGALDGAVASGGPQRTSAPVATTTAAPSSGRAADAEVTGTNNQETGVDESDVLKTDGEWTYVVRGRSVYVLHSETIGDLSEYATIDLGDNEYGTGLLLDARDPDDPDDDRLIVLSQTWSTRPYQHAHRSLVHTTIYGAGLTHLRVYDLADRTDPTILNEAWIEGDLIGGRLIDGTAYIVAHAYRSPYQLETTARINETDLREANLTESQFYTMTPAERNARFADHINETKANNRILAANLTLDAHLPGIFRPGSDGEPEPVLIDEPACRDFLATANATGRSVSTIYALTTGEETIDNSTTRIISSRPILYGATDALVLVGAARDPWWFWERPQMDEATDLHWFDLDGIAVTHRASGRIAGTVQDSFNVDVHDGTLRVATTTGQWARWWVEDPEPMMNHLVIMESAGDQLVPRGLVGGIAPGERIWSARFTADRAYIVTFEQIDPLWIIDLKDPTAPKILGELEIPGVSTYIHPLSDDLLLTIGLGPGADGLGLDFGRLQVSLFDVSEPSTPRRAHVLDVAPESGHAWSGAVEEHKAFTYWDRLGMLAIPLTTASYDQGSRYHVGLRLIEVDTDAKRLSIYGEVDQNDLITPNEWGWYGGHSIERSYFLGIPDEGEVSVYAMSGMGVTAHDLETLEQQDLVRFDVTK